MTAVGVMVVIIGRRYPAEKDETQGGKQRREWVKVLVDDGANAKDDVNGKGQVVDDILCDVLYEDSREEGRQRVSSEQHDRQQANDKRELDESRRLVQIVQRRCPSQMPLHPEHKRTAASVEESANDRRCPRVWERLGTVVDAVEVLGSVAHALDRRHRKLYRARLFSTHRQRCQKNLHGHEIHHDKADIERGEEDEVPVFRRVQQSAPTPTPHPPKNINTPAQDGNGHVKVVGQEGPGRPEEYAHHDGRAKVDSEEAHETRERVLAIFFFLHDDPRVQLERRGDHGKKQQHTVLEAPRQVPQLARREQAVVDEHKRAPSQLKLFFGRSVASFSSVWGGTSVVNVATSIMSAK